MSSLRSDVLAELLPHAAAAGAAAAAQLLDASSSADLDARVKSPFDQVTDTDLEIEAYLRDALLRAAPGSGIIGEELGDLPGEHVTWLVDPIDGTNNFVRGIPLATVSIGICVDGELCGGVVVDPHRRECFAGGDGYPLTVNGAAVRRRPRPPRFPVVLTDLPRPGESDRPAAAELAFYGRLLARSDVRRIGSSALALAWTAAGRADVACNLRIKPWDVAAGAALVRSAGGTYAGIGPGGNGHPADVAASGFVASSRTTELSVWIIEQLAHISGPVRREGLSDAERLRGLRPPGRREVDRGGPARAQVPARGPRGRGRHQGHGGFRSR
jgi:myo-inositol-1(or 4)-monophosphatase